MFIVADLVSLIKIADEGLVDEGQWRMAEID